MTVIALLMVGDGDLAILKETLPRNEHTFDVLYALCFTEEIADYLRPHPKCALAVSHEDVGYDLPATDGWRQAVYAPAAADHGTDNLFTLLNADEVWPFDPRSIPGAQDDGERVFMFRLPMFFTRHGEPWDETQPALDQLRWSFRPGWPEARMFHGGPTARFDPVRHYHCIPFPAGIPVVWTGLEIEHYPYRGPSDYAYKREASRSFSPANYGYDSPFWTPEMIDRVLRHDSGHYSQIKEGAPWTPSR